MQAIVDLIRGNVLTPLEVFEDILDTLEGTHIRPASEEPRMEMSLVMMKLIQS